MEYWTIALSILAVVFAIYYYTYWKGPNSFEQHGIPHAKQRSLLRMIWDIFVFPKPFAEVIHQWYNLHPDAKYIGIFNFSELILLIRDPELIKSIAIKNFDSFEDHLFFGEQDPLFGKNLMSLRGDKWRDTRALLSPAFTSSKMKTMFHLMSECAVNFSEHLMRLPSGKRIMEMKDISTRYASDVIATCAFGVAVDSMKNPENDFYVYGKKATNFSMISMLKILLHQHVPLVARLLNIKIIDARTSAFFMNLIADTIKTRDEKSITRPDMLQLMMDSRGKRGSGRELTIEDMTAQAFIFFFAGFESTSTLMSFMAYEIGVNSDIQENLRNEIDKVLEDSNGQPSYEAINEMVYLNAVINEALRMYPVSVAIDRLCVKDFEMPIALPGAKPYLMKKGMTLWFPFYGLQRDPKYFAEPDRFKPERFLNDSKEDQYNPDAYYPFGLGPRMCIGNRFALLETKVLLFHLLGRCKLKPCEKTTIPLKLNNRGFTMSAKNGFWLKIEPRENHRITISNTNRANIAERHQ